MTGTLDPREVVLRASGSPELPELEKRDYLDRLAHLSYRIEPFSPAALCVGIACLAVVTVLRFGIGWSETDLRYAIFLPAMLATGLLAGAPAAIGVVAASIFIVIWAFMPPYFALKGLTPPEVTDVLWNLFSGVSVVAFAEGCRTVFKRLRAHQLANDVLVRELAHRGRNIFAVIEVILQKTLASDRDQADALLGRLRAVRYANELLINRRDQAINIMSLLLQEFAPYGEGHLRTNGPRVDVEPEAARHLVLLFHELVTNAAKYGALASPAGLVTVEWSWNGQDLRIDWRESGGPKVVPPVKEGFGSRLINVCAKALAGTVQPYYAPDGFACSMSFRLRK
jgi:two-component sensor histidine kinase